MKLPLRIDGDRVLDADDQVCIWSNWTTRKDKAEIVRRVNAFDALLRACKQSLENYNNGSIMSPVGLLTGAIADAEGKP
jgi:hypothetical protein